jgi:hypothetical protein
MNLGREMIPWCLLGLTASMTQAVTFLDVTPGNNNATITQVVLTVDGVDVTQNSEAPGHGIAPLPISGTTPVVVKSVRINDGAQVGINLTFFNTSGASVANASANLFTANGIGVYKNETVTRSIDDPLGYLDAFAGTSMDTDLRNFSFHDSVIPALPGPSSPAADLDLLFLRSVRMDDYFMISERWGNSPFNVTALMQNGQPYPTANVLRLGGPLPDTGFGDPYTAHDWNTGYAPTGQFADQAQTITVFSAKKFFEGTGSSGGPIFGLRIDNNSEADMKIVGISGNTFADNELIPEPSSLLLTLAGVLCLTLARKRQA